jgi:hypothetical protein
MLRLDVERARKLFLEIPRLRLPPLSCDQTLSYDVTEFYQTMSEIADKSFSATEIQQGERLRFIQTYLETVESPAQVSPAISLMLNSSLSGVDLSVLAKSFSSVLGKVTVDPRSFMASTLHGNLITNVEQLLHQLKNADLPTSEVVVGSFHSYLLNQMKSIQCSDVMNSQSQVKQLWTNLDRFSKWLSQPIEAENIKASRIEHLEGGEQFWTTAESSRLLMKTKALRFGDGTEPLSIQARNSNDWQQQMELLLGEIERWVGSSEKTSLTYFHEKSNLYSSLFELAPTNPGKV